MIAKYDPIYTILFGSTIPKFAKNRIININEFKIPTTKQ